MKIMVITTVEKKRVAVNSDAIVSIDLKWNDPDVVVIELTNGRLIETVADFDEFIQYIVKQ